MKTKKRPDVAIKNERLNLRLDARQVVALTRHARALGVSMQQAIRLACAAAIKGFRA